MPNDVFAERRLRLRTSSGAAEILVQFGPVIRQDGAAFCRYTVSGDDGNLSRDIWGVDDVQAVELAMKMAGSDLDSIADEVSTASPILRTVKRGADCHLLYSPRRPKSDVIRKPC